MVVTRRQVRVSRWAVALALTAPACTHGATAPSGNVSVVVGRPMQPPNGAQISFYRQPVTLMLSNATTSAPGTPISHHVEVAVDDTFATIVQTKNVTQDGSGPTTVTLSSLNDSTTYFWRVRTTAGTSVGPFSSVFRFAIGPRVVLQTPALVAPPANSVQPKRPTFIVSNAGRTGPAGRLQYRFEIASDVSFNSPLAAGIVPEDPERTSFALTSDLPAMAVLYWRVQARDPESSVASEYAPSQAFAVIGPDDGVYPYELLLTVPPSCVYRYLGNESGQYPFSGTLRVSGPHVTFEQLRPGAYEQNLTVDLARTGDRLSGSIGTSTFGSGLGTASTTNGFEVGLWADASTGLPAQFDALATFGADQLRAAFDATVAVWTFPFGDGGGRCTARGFQWSLRPRR